MKCKKMISILLIMLMCATVLVACNGSSSKTMGNSSGTTKISNEDPRTQADKIIKEMNSKFGSKMVYESTKQNDEDNRIERYDYEDKDKDFSVFCWFDKYTYEFLGIEVYNLVENLEYHNTLKEKLLTLKSFDFSKQEKEMFKRGLSASYSTDKFGYEYKEFDVGDKYHFYDQGPDPKKLYRYVVFEMIKKDYYPAV